MDKVKITILENGTIKTDTDKISQANHSNAEGFLRQMFSLAGGAISRVLKSGAQGHTHTHDGVHYHEHGSEEQHQH